MPVKLPFNISLPKLEELTGAPKFLGVDIGTTSIKAVELSKEGGVIKLATYGLLENYGHLERVNEAIQTSSLKIMDEMTANLLRQLLASMKPTTKKAVFSVPVFSAFVTLMDLPQMTKKEFAAAIPFEARQYVPIPITDVALDWMDLGPPPGGDQTKTQILLVAVPQDVIAKYYRIAAAAGLQLRAIELETIALARAVAAQDPSTLMIVDIGARATNISVVDGGYVRITRSIDTGGGDLTQVIANALAVAPRVAEELKRTRGLSVAPGEEAFAGLMLPLLGVIISEIQKAAKLYFDKSRREVKKVILAGGTAGIPGLAEYFSRELGMEVTMANPFSSIAHDPMLEPVLKDLASPLAVAVGLAMRELLQY